VQLNLKNIDNGMSNRLLGNVVGAPRKRRSFQSSSISFNRFTSQECNWILWNQIQRGMMVLVAIYGRWQLSNEFFVPN